MKTAVIAHGLAGCLVVLAAAGCGTMHIGSHPTPEGPSPSPSPDASHQSAEALTRYSMGIIENLAGENEAALEHYRVALDADPDNVDLKLELAVAWLHASRFEEMDDILEDVVRRDPSRIRAYQLKALGLRMRGLHREALLPLAEAINREPQEAMHYQEKASIFSRLDDLPAAMSTLEQCLPRVDDRRSIFQTLGELYLREAGEILRDEKSHDNLPDAPLEVMRNATGEFPEDALLWTLYGDLLILHKDIEAAVEVLGHIEALNPDDPTIRRKLVLGLMAMGNYRGAIALMEEAARQNPEQDQIWYQLADLYELEDDHEGAAACYRKAIELQPASPKGYLRLSLLHMQQGDHEKAIEILGEGEGSVSNRLHLVELTGYACLASEHYTNAVLCFDRAVTLMTETGEKPLAPTFGLTHAVALQMTGNIEGAASLLRSASMTEPDTIRGYMALTLRDRDNQARITSTLEVLSRLQDIFPQEPDAFTLHALIAIAGQHYDTALSCLEQTERLALDAGDEEVLTAQFYFWMGSSAERIKLYDRAEGYFLQCISLEPDHADAHNYLAYMHAERGVKLDMAMDHIGVALAVEPENGAYLDTRGWIYYQQGDYDSALADINLAAEKLPEDPTISDHLGDIHQALGNHDDAVEWWKKSLAADPGNEAVKTKLAPSPEE